MTGRESKINRVLSKWGLKLSRTRRGVRRGPYSPLFPNRSVVDLDSLTDLAESIPGMLSEESAKFLFALCYIQPVSGDVVEIGSWQGYSTSFLARAVAESGNGRLYAIDHFKGNIGKERFYVVGESDLGDLQARFRQNVERMGLTETVKLLPMPNAQAAEILRRESTQVRFLFIDGDHTKEGVQRDVDLFFPFLVSGSIVVFDDCSPSAPGVVDAIDRLLDRGIAARAFAYSNTTVMMLKGAFPGERG